jgi:hypothetical protein
LGETEFERCFDLPSLDASACECVLVCGIGACDQAWACNCACAGVDVDVELNAGVETDAGVNVGAGAIGTCVDNDVMDVFDIEFLNVREVADVGSEDIRPTPSDHDVSYFSGFVNVVFLLLYTFLLLFVSMRESLKFERNALGCGICLSISGSTLLFLTSAMISLTFFVLRSKPFPLRYVTRKSDLGSTSS